MIVSVFLVLVVSVFVVLATMPVFGPVAASLIVLLLYLPLLWIGLAIGAKHLHDREKSAWWLLVFYVLPSMLQVFADYAGATGFIFNLAGAAIAIWSLIELGFLRGTPGPNEYGPDPLQRTS